jgi:hypothetical protein
MGAGPSWSPPPIQTAPSEPLAYPFPFPEACRSLVRAEMLRADRDFGHEEQSRILTYNERRALAVGWICRILSVFAHEACDLTRSGAPDWPLSSTEPRVSEVLRLIALQAEHSKFVRGDRPNLTDEGYVRKEVHAEIARSSEWSRYQDTLVSFMEQSSGQSAGSDPNRMLGRGQNPGTAAQTKKERPGKTYSTLGCNLDRLRKESGWSFDDIAKATELDKKLILGHINGGKRPHPNTLATYARTFTEKLGRPVKVAELEG